MLGKAVSVGGGEEVVKLQMTQRFIDNFANLGDRNNTLILNSNLGDINQ